MTDKHFLFFMNSTNVLARAVGRRKEATALVQFIKGTGKVTINNKPAETYLHNNACSLLAIKAPFDVLQKLESENATYQNIDTIVKVDGGGLVGQAEAMKLAVARAVCQLVESTTETPAGELSPARKMLKDAGYLTQDARVKERRKYGLKKARKASQYHKR
jgi:small subunit ribosomal protein S9